MNFKNVKPDLRAAIYKMGKNPVPLQPILLPRFSSAPQTSHAHGSSLMIAANFRLDTYCKNGNIALIER